MRQYRIREGLFFSSDDRELYRDRIGHTAVGRQFKDALVKNLGGKKVSDIPAPDFSWYGYNVDMDHSTSVSDYQNFNGIIGGYLNGMSNRLYNLTLASELLDVPGVDGEIREGMLRLTDEYPLHLFVMCDLGLILYNFLDRYLTVLDAKRYLFSEREQWKLDGFARGTVTDIMSNHMEWLTSRIGQQHCNNHLLAHSLAIIEGGLYYDRADWVNYGLQNREGIYTYLEDGFSDRGIGIEASFKYNLMTLGFLTRTAALLRRAGREDLYAYRNSRGYTLADFFTASPGYLLPDGKIVPLGDNYGHYPELGKIGVISDAVLALGDAADGLRYFIRNEARPSVTLSRLALGDIDVASPPDAKTEIYSVFGAAIVKSVRGRAYWNSDASVLAVRSGKSRIHNNPDQLAILFYVNGEYVIRDFEGIDRTSMHGFSSDIQRTLNRSRLAHSGVMCDGLDTRSIGEDLTCEYVDGGNVQRLTVSDERGLLCPGVRQTRKLTLSDGVLYDEYTLSSDTSHTYDYITHIYDDRQTPSYQTRPEIIRQLFPDNPDSPTFRWMLSPTVTETSGDVSEDWQCGDTLVSLSLTTGEPGKKVLFGLPEASNYSARTTKSLLVRVVGKCATFSAVYRFTRCSGQPTGDDATAAGQL